MKHNVVQEYGSTVIISDPTTASTGDSTKYRVNNIKGVEIRPTIATLDAITFILPKKRSPHAFPANHTVWKEFDELMAELDLMSDVDSDLDDDWVRESRRGSSSRLDYYDD